MSTNTKIILGVLAGATFMFCVVGGVILGFHFFTGQSKSTVIPATPIPVAPVVVAARREIPAQHFDLTSCVKVESARELEFGRGPFSFSFWFRTTTTNRLLTFMSKRKSGLSDGWVMHSLEDHSLFFYAAGCATTKAPAPNSRDGRWHHVAAVREGDQLALYLDSEPVGTGDNRCNFADRYPIRLGMDADTFKGWHFSGDMAEVHFYNRALSAGEVAEEWNGGQPLPRAVAGGGLVAGYHLGESADAAEDFSGHGFSGMLVGP